MKTAATTIEQSERLVALGIDPHTADMCYMYGRIEAFNTGVDGDVPAWSLSALLELMPKEMGIAVGAYPNSEKYTCFTLIDPDVEPTVADTPIAACIALIEQLVENGYYTTHGESDKSMTTMKKYRLIELWNDGKSMPIGDFDTYEDAALAMRNRGNTICYYRIEEVEESIMDRVKSYEDGCEVTGRLNADTDKEHWAYISPAHIKALEKLETITAALNEGWKPDWEDDKQEKWHVEYNSDAGRLEVDSYNVYSMASSRLYFKSRELAEYAAKQFAELYKQLLIEAF